MSNKLKSIVFSMIVLSFCLTISAQEKIDSASQTITKEQFYATFQKAREKTQTRKRRVKYMSQTDSPTTEDKRLLFSEFVPPNRERFVFDFYEADKLRRYEEIRIGATTYVRYDEENWRKKTEPEIARAYGKGGEIKTEFLLIKSQIINNQTTDLYQETETSSYPSLPNSKPTIEITKFWINSDGLLVKYSRSTTDKSLGELLNRIEDYEYDATIRINAPTIKTVRRKSAKKR